MLANTPCVWNALPLVAEVLAQNKAAEDVPVFEIAQRIDLSQYEGQARLLYSQEDPQGRVSYEGFLVKGVRHGQGRLTWKNGCCYEGQWTHDKIEGLGIMKWPSGQRYTGEMKNNTMEGVGKMVWTNLGVAYEGQWRQGRREGHGTITYEKDPQNRLCYEGTETFNHA